MKIMFNMAKGACPDDTGYAPLYNQWITNYKLRDLRTASSSITGGLQEPPLQI